MAITFRHYQHPDDYERVGQLMIAHYQPDNADGNWPQAAWEYMHYHPYLDATSLHKIGLWDDDGVLVAVAHYESCLGEAFFQMAPGYAHLKPEMLDHAETHLHGVTEDGRPYLRAYVNDFDTAFGVILKDRGYTLDRDWARPVSRFVIPDPFPPIPLREGFRLKSLADDNDLAKIHRVLWRGFDHPGEPSEEDIPERGKAQASPNYRLDLKIVVEAPDGNFAAFSGTWYDAINRIAYVEPVATDPDYRRMGLGRAAVLEGIRRCAALGATVAYVGSDLPFYRAIGFERLYDTQCWLKFF